MRYLSELCKDADLFAGLQKTPVIPGKKYRINLLALGDVGGTLLTGLTLLGGETIESIGICDRRGPTVQRFEMEMNQIAWPFEADRLPQVSAVSEEELFAGDVFVFCASKGVPEAGAEVQDVRMAQFAENRLIVEHYARLAASKKYQGIFAVVSDPVDPLCMSAFLASGLSPGQFRGFGLGVMNSRAMYFAKREPRFASFLEEGRVFGPHGQDLVVANSIGDYDDALSGELTRLVVESNLRMRELGFKPYIAPALSSGAISLVLMLSGQWHYSSAFVGSGTDGAFLGMKNRVCEGRIEAENLPLPAELYERIRQAYETLRGIV